MTLSTQQANEALRDMAQTEHRASVQRGYESGAPHFIVWGIIWILGYGGSDLNPERAGWLWLVLDLIGFGGTFLIARAAHLARPSSAYASGRGVVLRYAASAVAMAAFIAATYFVMRPREVAQFGAFPALIMAFIYVCAGIWRGRRWTIAGVALGALTLLGFGLLHEHFMLWMAGIGGGTLLLTGLWMRRP